MKKYIITLIVTGLCSFGTVFADPAQAPVVNDSNSNGLPQSTIVTAQPSTNTNQTLQPDIDQIRALMQQGKLTEAKDAALGYLKLYPNDVDAKFMLGLIYYKQNDYSAAANVLSDGLQTHPDYADVRLLLIQTNLKLKHYSDALTLANEGLTIDPKNNDLLNAKIKAAKALRSHK